MGCREGAWCAHSFVPVFQFFFPRPCPWPPADPRPFASRGDPVSDVQIFDLLIDCLFPPSDPGTSHGTWPATTGYYPTATCNYGGNSGGSGNSSVNTTSADTTMYHHHHSHHQANGGGTSYSPQGGADHQHHHHSLQGWVKSANKEVVPAPTWTPDNYS